MSQSLGQQATTGALWSFLGSGGQQLIRFGVTVVMARLLAPEVFGLVAMLEVFLIIAEKFIYAGFGGALVQKKEVTQTDESTLFYYNLFAAFTGYLFLFLSAPWIAKFFGQDELVAILRVAAVGLIIGALTVVQGTRLTRQLEFRIQTIASLIGTLTMGVSGVALALAGYGVWSLVWATLIRRAVSCLVLWLAGKWRPTCEFSQESMSHIAGYGSPILISSLIDGFASNIHTLVIGKAFGAADLGFFNRGRAVQTIAVQSSVNPLLGVLFPGFSRIKDEPERLAKAYLRALRLIAFIAFPLLLMLSACAEATVTIVYGEKWLPSVPYLSLLALFAPWLPLSAVGFGFLKSQSNSMRFLRMSLLRHLLTVAGIAAGLPWGIEGLIMGMGAAQIASSLWVGWFVSRVVPATIKDQLKMLLPPLLMAAACHLGVLLTHSQSWSGPTVSLLIAAGIFVVFYGGSALALKAKVLREILALSKGFWVRIPLLRDGLAGVSRFLAA